MFAAITVNNVQARSGSSLQRSKSWHHSGVQQVPADAPDHPARFNADLGIFGFGTSGYVQAPPAEDDINIVQVPISGRSMTCRAVIRECCF
jgi:hypothetical protein